MARHPNQKLNYGRPLNGPTPPRAQQLLARSKGKLPDLVLPKAPPHVCDFGQASGRCRRCGKAEAAT